MVIVSTPSWYVASIWSRSQTLPQEQFALELPLDPLCDLELVSFYLGPAPHRPDAEDVLFDRKLDGAEIDTRKVEKNVELVAPAVRVHWHLPSAAVVKDPVERPEFALVASTWLDLLSGPTQ